MIHTAHNVLHTDEHQLGNWCDVGGRFTRGIVSPELTYDLQDGQRCVNMIGQLRRWSNRPQTCIPLTTGLCWDTVAFTEGTTMDTLMIGQTVMIVFVRTAAPDTNQVARTALRPADFDAGP